MTTKALTGNQKPLTTISVILGLWRQLSPRRRIQLGLLLVVMLLSGFAQLVSLGAILPFLVLLSNPQQLWQQPLIQSLSIRFGFSQPEQLVLPATLVFVFAAVLASLCQLLNLWLNDRLSAAVGSDLSCEAYKRTLYQPYEIHIQLNSSEVIANLTTYMYQTVTALNSILSGISSAVMSVLIVVGLVFINPTVALSALAILGIFYAALMSVVRKNLNLNAKKIAFEVNKKIQSVQEGLGSIRDLILDDNQASYLNFYEQIDRSQRLLQAKNSFLGRFPRFILETLGVSVIVSLGYFAVTSQYSDLSSNIIPLLGAYAFGFQRLIPSLQQVYLSWSNLNGSSTAINAVLSTASLPIMDAIKVDQPINMSQSIRFENVSYRYGKHQNYILSGLNVEIFCGQRIGIIGNTGSGKSTFIDLLIGLLRPTDGSILVDGENLYDMKNPDRILAWRAAISHVPQSVYLADTSIAENIALSNNNGDIDLNRVKHSAKLAQIDGFIESDIGGYERFVGERGIKMSGGQRQRLGIARALYKNTNILVLDEATSALDHKTEESIIKSLEGISRRMTIIMIAHRLTTLAGCDRIFRVINGRIIEVKPSELLQ